jgi:hypothetical protein
VDIKVHRRVGPVVDVMRSQNVGRDAIDLEGALVEWELGRHTVLD